MASKATWTKWGLRLACETSKRPLPRATQVFRVPDFGETGAPLISVVYNASGSAKGPYVAITTAAGPATGETWALCHKAGTGAWEEVLLNPSQALSTGQLYFNWGRLEENTTHYFRLRVQSASGQSVYRPAVSVFVPVRPPVDRSGPALPLVSDPAYILGDRFTVTGTGVQWQLTATGWVDVESLANSANAAAAAAQASATAAGAAAAYADALARSSYNLIKNGNSEDASPHGDEANGVYYDPSNSYTGNNCRRFNNPGSTSYFNRVGSTKCDPGDQFYFSAMMREYAGTAHVTIAFYDILGNYLNRGYSPAYAGSAYTLQEVSFEAPANATTAVFYIEQDGSDTTFVDALFACLKTSVAMLEVGVLQAMFVLVSQALKSTNYVPGSAGNAPVGLCLSALPFTSTLKDGSTISALMELGGLINMNGHKVATLTDRAMTAFNRILNGSFVAGVAPWIVANTGNFASAGTVGRMSARANPAAATAYNDLYQSFSAPPQTSTVLLKYSWALWGGNAYNNGGSASIQVTVTNEETGAAITTDVNTPSWTGVPRATPTYTERSIDITSLVSGGGSYRISMWMSVTSPAVPAGTCDVYLDIKNVKVVM